MKLKSNFRIIEIAMMLLFLGIAYKFISAVFTHISGGSSAFRYDLLAFIMPLVVLCAFVQLLKINAGVINRSWIAIGFFYCVYAVITTVANQLYGLAQLPMVIINMTYWFVAMYVTYEYKRSNPNETWIVKLMFITLLLCFVGFCSSMFSAQNLSYYANRDLLLNSVYYCIFLLPFVYLSPKAWVRNTGLVLVFIATVMSNKRAAMVVIVVCLFVVMMAQMKSATGVKKITRSILYTLCVVILIYLFQWLVDYFDLAIVERFQSFMSGEDTGSGRTEIWMDTINQINSENFFQSLIGRGYRAVSFNSAYSGISEAHNDYLQILFDYGFIGLFGIVCFVVSLLSQLKGMKRCNYHGHLPYLLSLLIFGVCSMMSMCLIYPYWFLGISTFWGYALAEYALKK